ncbi:MAG: cysteine hydrolase [Chloroflexi bacterium]|nr:cysteine hydrolase [Chloroflexota bacterium]
MKPLQNFSLNKQNAILIIVDIQNEFAKPGGKLGSAVSAKIIPGVISAVQGLADQARAAGIPIIYIQSVRTLKEPEFTVFGRQPHLEIGTWASEIVDELKPHEGDTVVQKFSHDPFYRKDLDEVLEKLVPDPTKCYAVVTGGAINVCVYHTVMGFYLRNYWTVVPVDCVYYISEEGRDRALGQYSEERPYPNVFLSRSDLIDIS